MSKLRFRKKYVLGVTFFFLMTFISLPTMAADPIKVGLITPLTGSNSTFGQSVRDAIVMGIDEINASGGIKGRELQLIVHDDKGDPTESANVARRLIDREQVSLIFGPVITPCVMAVAPIAQSAKVPMMTPTGTGDEITAIGDYIFRAAYKDSLQGSAMARFAVENLGIKTVGIIYDIASDYSTGLMNAFKTTFEELGGRVVTVQSYATGDSDFSAQLTSIALRNPEALYIPDYYSAAGPIMLQANHLGIDSVMLGVDGWDSPDIFGLADGYEEGGYFINHYSPLDTREATIAFADKFSETYGRAPDALAALGYDAVKIVEATLNAAPSINRETIKDTMGTVKNIVAATADIDMDPEGTPYKPLVILQYQDGIAQMIDRVLP